MPPITPNKEEQEKMEAERKLKNTMWEDLTPDQKIERTNEIVKAYNSSLGRELQSLRELVNKLNEHSHKDNGDIVVPLQSRGFGMGMGETCGSQRTDGKRYF